jgi:epoxide hydrolase-like predicted phosphatase
MITALAFDMTGVITRSPLHVMDEYGDRLSLPPRTLSAFFKTQKFDQVLLGHLPMSELVDDLVTTVNAEFDIDVDSSVLFEAMRAARVIDPRIAEVIKELRPNYRLAVLTNNTNDVAGQPGRTETAWWSDDGEHALSPKDFEFVMSSNELGLMKPDQRIYIELIKRLAVAPHEVVYIDDIAENLIPARALGMASVHYRDAAQCRSALRALGIDLEKTQSNGERSDSPPNDARAADRTARREA